MVANVKTNRRAVMPTQVAPMLAVLSDIPVHTTRYGYEFKWDGVRALTYVTHGRWRMVSRNVLEMQGRYPECAACCVSSKKTMFCCDGRRDGQVGRQKMPVVVTP